MMLHFCMLYPSVRTPTSLCPLFRSSVFDRFDHAGRQFFAFRIQLRDLVQHSLTPLPPYVRYALDGTAVSPAFSYRYSAPYSTRVLQWSSNGTVEALARSAVFIGVHQCSFNSFSPSRSRESMTLPMRKGALSAKKKAKSPISTCTLSVCCCSSSPSSGVSPSFLLMSAIRTLDHHCRSAALSSTSNKYRCWCGQSDSKPCGL